MIYKARRPYINAILEVLPDNAIDLYLRGDSYEDLCWWLNENEMSDVKVIVYVKPDKILRWQVYALYYIETKNKNLMFYLLKYGSLKEAFMKEFYEGN